MTLDTFRSIVRPLFGTVSGGGTAKEPARIAVRNKTQYRAVAQFVTDLGCIIRPLEPGARFPILCSIVLPRICDRCGATHPGDQSCGCFDNGGQ